MVRCTTTGRSGIVPNHMNNTLTWHTLDFLYVKNTKRIKRPNPARPQKFRGRKKKSSQQKYRQANEPHNRITNKIWYWLIAETISQCAVHFGLRHRGHTKCVFTEIISTHGEHNRMGFYNVRATSSQYTGVEATVLFIHHFHIEIVNTKII